MQRRSVALVSMLLALTAPTVLSACNRGTVASGTAFCDRVAKRLPELKGPVTDGDTAKRAVAAYKDVGTVAPAPVREAWATVTSLVQAAASLDVTSPAAQSAFAERAIAADPQITLVVTYTRDTCGIEFSPKG